MSGKKRNFFIYLSLITIAIGSGACGNTTRNSAVTGLKNSDQVQFPQNNNPGGQPYTNTSGINQQHWALIKGNYTGTLFKDDLGDVISQPYTMEIREESFNGATYGFLSIASNGPIGSVQINAYLAYGGYYTDWYNGSIKYYFMTNAMDVELLSPNSISISFLPALRPNVNGQNTTFSIDPTQSAIYIMDCGFSSSLACNNTSSDAWFGNGLQKTN